MVSRLIINYNNIWGIQYNISCCFLWWGFVGNCCCWVLLVVGSWWKTTSVSYSRYRHVDIGRPRLFLFRKIVTTCSKCVTEIEREEETWRGKNKKINKKLHVAVKKNCVWWGYRIDPSFVKWLSVIICIAFLVGIAKSVWFKDVFCCLSSQASTSILLP